MGYIARKKRFVHLMKQVLSRLCIGGCKCCVIVSELCRLRLISFPVRLQYGKHLTLGHSIFASDLDSRTILELQDDRVVQFLAIEVWCVRHRESSEREPFLCNSFVNFHSGGDCELQVACVVDRYNSALPKLKACQ